MVWTKIPLDGHTQLYVFPRGGTKAARDRSDVLEHIVRSHASSVVGAFILMQDNERARRADVSMTFIDDTCISVINWPARSPYINPIEHTWGILCRYSTTAASSRACGKPYRCPGSGIAVHTTKWHQEYDKSLSGVCER